MAKRKMKPGNMLYPLPVVLVGVRGKGGESNLITVAWCGTVCSTPPMLSVSIRKDRYSLALLRESGEFSVNLVGESLARATDLCGVISGRDVNKWEKAGLNEEEAEFIQAPLVAESPVNIECRVKETLELGSHIMFVGEVLAVRADERYFDEKGGFRLDQAALVAYSHGEYRSLGPVLGTFGYSVRKKAPAKPAKEEKKHAVKSGKTEITPAPKPAKAPKRQPAKPAPKPRKKTNI